MLKDQELEKFKKLLNDQYTWPSLYLFKFVVPGERVEEVCALFPDHKLHQRASKTGKYISVSVELKLESPDIVIAIYQQASQIEGLISL